jgi:hypothetical protein
MLSLWFSPKLIKLTEIRTGNFYIWNFNKFAVMLKCNRNKNQLITLTNYNCLLKEFQPTKPINCFVEHSV